MNRNDKIAKSRLGRLLVNRGYITENQLAEALVLQAEGNCLLGEVLISKGYLSEKDLNRTLKHQKRYRYTAAFVAMAAAPFQPMLAMAASPLAAMPLPNARVELSEIDIGKFGGLKMLDDSELSGVNAQGFGGLMPVANFDFNLGKHADAVAAGLHNKYQEDEEYEEQNDEQIAAELSDTVLTMVGLGPISDMIEAKITVEGLKFKEGRSQIEVLGDGRVRMYMPTEIAKISMEDIRVKGNTSGPTMGSIYMSDIRYNPQSNYTIGGKTQRYF